MKNKKGQINKILLGVIVLLFGALGIFFWGFGIINNLPTSSWIGKVMLGSISLIVLIMEKFLK